MKECSRPGLALFDLDNTLLDRVEAFAIWARGFVEANDLASDALEIIIAADEDGYKHRDVFITEMKDVFDLSTSLTELLECYHVDYPSCYSVTTDTVEAVRLLRSSGWKVGIVTNGPASQMLKIETTNLTDEFDAVCVSDLVGFHKPSIEIFQGAARACGLPLEGWMVGDSVTADIGGGREAGLRTIWITRGRPWPMTDHSPDAIVATIPEAVSVILGTSLATHR